MDKNYKICKDKAPNESVNNFRKILRKLDIEVEEDWHKKSCYGTYSLKLSVKKTNIRSWGKGCTKDLARASAYGEFFERYLNGMLTSKLRYGEAQHLVSTDEKYLTAQEVISQNSEIVNSIFSNNNLSKLSKQEKAKWLRKFFSPNYGDKYLCVPFENLDTKKIKFVPYSISCYLYGSNGMAEGNTREEALVEGISEIIERHVNKEIVHKKLTLPDIPESYINKFPSVKEMWELLKAQKNYNVFLKDASLGGKWPVVALIVMEKNSNRYGINFGAHPNFEFAAQRAFTEAAQGIVLKTFSKIHSLYHKDVEKETKDNMNNIFTGGLISYPTELFQNKPSFAFKAVNINSTNNKKLLNYLLALLKSNGHKILIRDTTCFGIPAFQIVVPNVSNFWDGKEYQIKWEKNYHKTFGLINSAYSINENSAKFIIKTLDYYSSQHQINTLSSFIPKYNNLSVPFGMGKQGRIYFMSMLYFLTKDYQKAHAEYNKLSSNIDRKKCNKNEIVYLAIADYLQLRAINKNHLHSIEILTKFYDPKLCGFINYIFKKESEVIKKQYPNFERIDANPKNTYEIRKSYEMTLKLMAQREKEAN